MRYLAVAGPAEAYGVRSLRGAHLSEFYDFDHDPLMYDPLLSGFFSAFSRIAGKAARFIKPAVKTLVPIAAQAAVTAIPVAGPFLGPMAGAVLSRPPSGAKTLPYYTPPFIPGPVGGVPASFGFPSAASTAPAYRLPRGVAAGLAVPGVYPSYQSTPTYQSAGMQGRGLLLPIAIGLGLVFFLARR